MFHLRWRLSSQYLSINWTPVFQTNHTLELTQFLAWAEIIYIIDSKLLQRWPIETFYQLIELFDNMLYKVYGQLNTEIKCVGKIKTKKDIPIDSHNRELFTDNLSPSTCSIWMLQNNRHIKKTKITSCHIIYHKNIIKSLLVRIPRILENLGEQPHHSSPCSLKYTCVYVTSTGLTTALALCSCKTLNNTNCTAPSMLFCALFFSLSQTSTTRGTLYNGKVIHRIILSANTVSLM